jgi:hypothetical protein
MPNARPSLIRKIANSMKDQDVVTLVQSTSSRTRVAIQPKVTALEKQQTRFAGRNTETGVEHTCHQGIGRMDVIGKVGSPLPDVSIVTETKTRDVSGRRITVDECRAADEWGR